MTYLNYLKLQLFAIALIFTTQAATAQSFGNFTAFPSERVVLLDGAIGSDSPENFRKALRAVGDPETVVLRSPGGVVVAALEIADQIQDLNLRTFVEVGEYCASACSIVFFSGTQRVALGELGVHQMSAPRGGSLAGIQFVLADVLSAFDTFGVDDRVMQRMLRTPSEAMYYFTVEEKVTWNIDRFTQAAPVPVQASFSSFAPDRYHIGPVALPSFSGRDAWAKNFRTRIRQGIKDGPNFSGHYSVIEIGCGTSCRFAYVADVSTGEVFSFPYGGEEQHELGLVYSSDSRLLRATWRVYAWDHGNGSKDVCISQDLLWSGSEFKVIHEDTFEVEDFGVCSIEY